MDKHAFRETCPEWYKAERGTEKAIKMLVSLKELSFYLNNPDEYIRRLAILRINELKLKDSLEVLKDIADNPIENLQNRELAAWTIKCVCSKWGIDLYAGSKLLGKYTGVEKYSDLFKVTVSDTMPGPRLEVSASFIASELPEDADMLRHSEDICFEACFDFREWLTAWSANFTARAGTLLAAAPRALLPFLYKNMIKPAARCPGIMWGKVNAAITASRSRKKTKEKFGTPYKMQEKKAVSLSQTLQKAFYRLLYVIFTPIRLLVRHARPAVLLVVLAYFLLTVTTPGRLYFYRHTGIDLSEAHAKAFYTARDFITYSWSEAKELVGIHDNAPYSIQQEDTLMQSGMKEPAGDKLFRVTAKTGLNLRTEPTSSAAKVSGQRLDYDTTVTYLSKSRKDPAGGLWHYIRTPDGTTGWAYAKWLQETGGDTHAGK